MSSRPSLGANAIQPYRMHVSQRYLDLTAQKLEMTRLPREPIHTDDNWDFGAPKSEIDVLVDHWQEKYNWRTQESFFNDKLPQYRTSINGTRLHFVHKTSTAPNAIPLLFAHGWPESFISITQMIDGLVEVGSPGSNVGYAYPFHVVVPSIPGFGFSDPLPEAGNHMHSTAEAFDALMKGLGYHQYIAHGTGWGFRICRILALTHAESCIGVHTVNPDLPQPSPDFGYGIGTISVAQTPGPGMPMPSTTGHLQQQYLTMPTPERPQTTAYALCDSPAGLLAHVMDALKPPPVAAPSPATSSPESLRPPTASRSSSSPRSVATPQSQGRSPESPLTPATPLLELRELPTWTPTAIIDWTMLYWLPGPEVSLRWLVNSTALIPSLWGAYSGVPLGITQFRQETMMGVGSVETQLQWAEAYHRIALVRRRGGSVRFPAWERPLELVADLREFARFVANPMIPTPGKFTPAR